MRNLFRRLGWFFNRGRHEREIQEEMLHHLAMQAEEGDANPQRRFGNVALLREDSRAVWTFVFWEQLSQDIRYAFRTMAANRLFTAMAILSLALGIGANTAIYSFLDAILMRTLPVKEPGRLVLLNWKSAGRPAVIHSLHGTMSGDRKSGSSSPDFPFAAWQKLRTRQEVTSELFAWAPAFQMNVVAKGQAEVSEGYYVSGNYYSGLGIAPAAGRLIGDEDDRTGAHPVAVIAWNFWKARFASEAAVIGQTILIDRIPFEIIGVTPPGFFGVDSSFEPSLFLPLHAEPLLARKPAEEVRNRFFDPNFYWVEMMGRLQPGIGVAQAQAVFASGFKQFVESTATTAKERQMLPVLRAAEGAGGLNSLRRQYSKPLYILMGMVGLILIIACANIANLLLARAAARSREIAIRLSLGAGRMRVIRQLITESVLLSASGGLLGLGIAVWAIRLIAWLISDGREGMAIDAHLSWGVLTFTAALALVTGIAFGLAPAIQATKDSVAPALKATVAGGWRGRSRFGMSKTLIIVQMAISLLLAVAAGLFVRTLGNLHAVELGFNREHILLFRLDARQAGYKDDAEARLYARLGERFRRIPGVKSAGLSNFPLVAGYWNDSKIVTPGQTAPDDKPLSACVITVNDEFLSTMGISVILGRELQARDLAAPRSAVVSELFARKFFPGVSPIGRHFALGDGSEDFEIVGVTKAAHYNSIDEETPPVAYLPYTHGREGPGAVWFELRTFGDPLTAASAVRGIVHDEASAVPVTNLKTQAAQIDETIGQPRLFADLCTCFAVLALVIGCVGLYGAMAYAVERRKGEIGIRLALGAKAGEIVWMVLRQVLVLAAAGIAIGWIAARQSAHFVASFLYGMKTDDAVAFWGSASVLLAAVLAAAWGPARRAARVNPMVALRNE